MKVPDFVFHVDPDIDVHYKRLAHSENKRVWMYFISIKCFVGICEYGRHAKRKEIAQAWVCTPLFLYINSNTNVLCS